MQSWPSHPARDATPGGRTRQRWAWTHRYGTPLLVASIVAVVVSGSGLAVAVVALGDENGGGGGDGPTPTATVRAGPCHVGGWEATEIEEDIDTGVLELASPDEGPVFTYREDGTGGIDFGERTAFLFRDRIFGDLSEPTTQYLTGEVQFDYFVENGTIRHSYVDITDGARMIADPLPLPDVWYVPAEEVFTYECDGNTMTLDAENYSTALQRVPA